MLSKLPAASCSRHTERKADNLDLILLSDLVTNRQPRGIGSRLPTRRQPRPKANVVEGHEDANHHWHRYRHLALRYHHPYRCQALISPLCASKTGERSVLKILISSRMTTCLLYNTPLSVDYMFAKHDFTIHYLSSQKRDGIGQECQEPMHGLPGCFLGYERLYALAFASSARSSSRRAPAVRAMFAL